MWRLRHCDTITHEKSVMTIFVGNLAFTTTEEELALLLHPYGVINRVRIVGSVPQLL